MLWLWAVCTLFAYLYFEFPIERVKEYKSLANICISESLLYCHWWLCILLPTGQAGDCFLSSFSLLLIITSSKRCIVQKFDIIYNFYLQKRAIIVHSQYGIVYIFLNFTLEFPHPHRSPPLEGIPLKGIRVLHTVGICRDPLRSGGGDLQSRL